MSELFAISLMLLTGCGVKPEAIAGRVTLDGAPLEQAAIQFTPAGGGRKTGAVIRGGQFELSSTDGLLPGQYHVQIVDLPPLTHSPAPRRVFPHRYANDSKWSITIEAGGTRNFDFELHSQE